MALPQLSEEQRAANLKKAAEARHARAELRDKIKTGKVTLESVLSSDDPAATRMPVRALIESLPGYGKAKAAKIMDELRKSHVLLANSPLDCHSVIQPFRRGYFTLRFLVRQHLRLEETWLSLSFPRSSALPT